MANSSDQGFTSVANMANSSLPPKFLSLMKSARKAKFDAELFISKIDLLARQYSQGFDEILRQGAHETRDEVIHDIASEMDMEVSSYIHRLEDFKAKLKNGSVGQGHDNSGQSNDGPLPGNPPVGIQGVRNGVLQLQQQIRNMEDSNSAFQKRFEDALDRNEERLLEITALKKELAEALESNRKLKDDMMQIPVPAVVPGDSPMGIQEELRDRAVTLQQQIRDTKGSNTAFQKRFEDVTAQKEERVQEVRALKKQLGEALESNRKLKDDMMQIPVPPVVAKFDESVQTEKRTEDRVGALLNKWGDAFPELMDLWQCDKKSLRDSKKLAGKIRILDVKMVASGQALSRLMQINSDVDLIISTLKDYEKFSTVHKSKLRYTNWYPARP